MAHWGGTGGLLRRCDHACHPGMDSCASRVSMETWPPLHRANSLTETRPCRVPLTSMPALGHGVGHVLGREQLGAAAWAGSRQSPGDAGRRRYLSVREGVVVGPHLGVHVLQVPLEAAALQPLAQGPPLGHVPKVHPWVLPGGEGGREA